MAMDVPPVLPLPQRLPLKAQWCIKPQLCVALEVAQSPVEQRLGLMPVSYTHLTLPTIYSV